MPFDETVSVQANGRDNAQWADGNHGVIDSNCPSPPECQQPWGDSRSFSRQESPLQKPRYDCSSSQRQESSNESTPTSDVSGRRSRREQGSDKAIKSRKIGDSSTRRNSASPDDMTCENSPGDWCGSCQDISAGNSGAVAVESPKPSSMAMSALKGGDRAGNTVGFATSILH